MLNLYGGSGMGSSGMGMGAGGMAPGGGMSPQMLAMLMQMQGGQGGGTPTVPPPGPMQAPAAGTPMANYLGAQAPNPAMMAHPQPMPAGQPPGMNGGQGDAAAPAPGISPQMMQMMQMLKGQQSGLPAQQAAGTAPVWNPQNPVGTSSLGGATANQGGMLQNWLASLLGGGGAAGGAG